MTSNEICLGHSSRVKFGDGEENSGINDGLASALVDMCYKNNPIIDISSYFCLYFIVESCSEVKEDKDHLG